MKVWFKWVWPGVGPFAEFDRKQNGNLDGYFVIKITATKKHSNMFLLFCISQISTRYGFLLGIPFYRSMAMNIITLTHVGRGYSTLFVCAEVINLWFVCVLPQNCCPSSIISKSKQATSHKLGNHRRTMVLYKTDKFLQSIMA